MLSKTTRNPHVQNYYILFDALEGLYLLRQIYKMALMGFVAEFSLAHENVNIGLKDQFHLNAWLLLLLPTPPASAYCSCFCLPLLLLDPLLLLQEKLLLLVPELLLGYGFIQLIYV